MMPPGTTPTNAMKNASFANSRVPNLPFLSRAMMMMTSVATTSRKIIATMRLAAYSHW